ncbi:hypothetical protein [Kitasatospora paranensis]|uniref:Uncharacterized protein n=1 Tax=Kitasatospora paranensis TaxID=258053 RepID=A0ABW2G6K8_9ACTN
MDDLPQGDAGGVPGHADESDQRVPTVRAGTPVAEQKDVKDGEHERQEEHEHDAAAGRSGAGEQDRAGRRDRAGGHPDGAGRDRTV